MQGKEEEELHKKNKKKSDKKKKRDTNQNGLLEEKADSGGTIDAINGGEVKEDEISLRGNGMKKKSENKATEDEQVAKEMGHMGWENKKRKVAEVDRDLEMDEEPSEEVELELTESEERKRLMKKSNKEKEGSSAHGILVNVLDHGDQLIKKAKEFGKDKSNKRTKRNKNQGDGANEKDHVVWENEKNMEEYIDLGLKKGECEEMVEIELTKDAKKKKKENKNKEKVHSHSSWAENIVNVLDGGNRIGKGKEVAKEKRNKGEESSKEEEEISKLKIVAKNRNKKRDKADIDVQTLENEKLEVSNNTKRRIIKDKGIAKDRNNADRDTGLEDLNERKKEKKDKDDKVIKSFLTEVSAGELTNGRNLLTDYTEVLNDAGYTGSNSKKKREKDKDENKKRKKDKKDKEPERNDPSLEESPTGVFDSGNKMITKDRGIAKNKPDKGTPSAMKKGERSANHSANSQSMKTPKRVSFSGHVEVFPLTDDMNSEEENCQTNLVHGKRFSPQEDEMVKEAVSNYLLAHGLGEEGLDKILHCKNYPELKNCWKDIAAAIPWRPYRSVYYRAHILYERDDKRKWDPEDYEIIRSFHKKHGSNWKVLADALGKHRFHVKDTWRRIKLPGWKKGSWSQDEYQTLFDLVNMDLRMKAFEEKKTKHGMLRDNISWEAISDKLSTRHNASCCQKWYNQLSSPMVAEGLWANSDDYRLLDMLMKLDAYCAEDVDWDNLLEHRSGEVCHKRWNQMAKHVGGYRDRSFSEQVELLSNRYCPDLLEVRDPGGEDALTDL